MDVIKVAENNIEHEHICCAISDQKSAGAKKEWMKGAVLAMVMNSVSLKAGEKRLLNLFRRKTHGRRLKQMGICSSTVLVAGSPCKAGMWNALLAECINEAKRLGRKGLVAVSSDKKRPFLSDPRFLIKKGFIVADSAAIASGFCISRSMKMRSAKIQGKMQRMETFRSRVFRSTTQIIARGISKYIPLLEKIAEERNAPLTVRKIENKTEAQNAPSPFSTYSVYYNGEILTNEMFSGKNFIKFLDEKGF